MKNATNNSKRRWSGAREHNAFASDMFAMYSFVENVCVANFECGVDVGGSTWGVVLENLVLLVRIVYSVEFEGKHEEKRLWRRSFFQRCTCLHKSGSGRATGGRL